MAPTSMQTQVWDLRVLQPAKVKAAPSPRITGKAKQQFEERRGCSPRGAPQNPFPARRAEGSQRECSVFGSVPAAWRRRELSRQSLPEEQTAKSGTTTKTRPDGAEGTTERSPAWRGSRGWSRGAAEPAGTSLNMQQSCHRMILPVPRKPGAVLWIRYNQSRAAPVGSMCRIHPVSIKPTSSEGLAVTSFVAHPLNSRCPTGTLLTCGKAASSRASAWGVGMSLGRGRSQSAPELGESSSSPAITYWTSHLQK